MERILSILTASALIFNGATAKQWPYDRYAGETTRKGEWIAQKQSPEFETGPPNGFVKWLHQVVANDPDTGPLSQTFKNGSIPHDASLEDLIDHIDTPTRTPENEPEPPPNVPSYFADRQAAALFSHLPYPIDVGCTSDPFKW
jgi:hypothetical protein